VDAGQETGCEHLMLVEPKSRPLGAMTVDRWAQVQSIGRQPPPFRGLGGMGSKGRVVLSPNPPAPATPDPVDEDKRWFQHHSISAIFLVAPGTIASRGMTTAIQPCMGFQIVIKSPKFMPSADSTQQVNNSEVSHLIYLRAKGDGPPLAAPPWLWGNIGPQLE